MQVPATTYLVNGEAICAKRMQAGIEVKELADTVGVSDRYIRMLETGHRKRMRPGNYARLRAALNATETELLLDPHRGPTDPERT